MNKKHVLPLFEIFLCAVILISTASSCKKDRDKAIDKIVEIKDKIINGYWSNFEGLTVNVENDKGYVVDFGGSGLGSNQSVFNPTMPYFIDITRTGSDTWNAQVVTGNYDSNSNLTSVSYTPTAIKLTTDNGINTFTLTNVEPNSTSWTQMGSSYVPPTDPYNGGNNPTTCDTTSVLTTSGNSISLVNYWRGDMTVNDLPVRSGIYVPLMANPTNCHYKMSGLVNGTGNIIEAIIYFSDKPTTDQTFQLIGNEYASISSLDDGSAAMTLEYDTYESTNTSGTINVTVSAGKVTATGNVQLDNSAGHFTPCQVTFTMIGE